MTVATKVCVVGLGYIGLPTAALLAGGGMSVLGVDIRPDVVDIVNSGRIHIEEVDLEGLVRAVVTDGSLRAATAPGAADVFIMAVPTPFAANHVPDVGHVLSATRSIAPVLKAGDLVILESTSPVGTTEQIRDVLAELRSDLRMPFDTPGDIAIAYCPERVLPGRTLVELRENDRSIGGISPECAIRARDFYRQFVVGECIVTRARVAELVKLSENAFRDVNIAFANELSLVADQLELDVWEVIALANRHPRVQILSPGPGVGGHCIAVDPWFIVNSAPEKTRLIRTAREVNDGKPHYVVARAAALAERYPDARIACLGLAFKANIDDLRESPALEIAEELAKRFPGRVDWVEPHIDMLPKATDGVALITAERAIETCDILVLLVDHRQFATIPRERLVGKHVLDTRGIWRGVAG